MIASKISSQVQKLLKMHVKLKNYDFFAVCLKQFLDPPRYILLLLIQGIISLISFYSSQNTMYVFLDFAFVHFNCAFYCMKRMSKQLHCVNRGYVAAVLFLELTIGSILDALLTPAATLVTRVAL